jgi:D-alanyl-D-alanine-carboxypeptidase/D-alanyl-D-alanine-endopeptidase
MIHARLPRTLVAFLLALLLLMQAHLVSEKGLDHAGEPTGIGLGWIHILPVDSPSHIIEKTGGGAGFETYIALNHARNAAIFLD